MPALTKEIAIAMSFKQQPDLTTATIAADMWRLRQTNADIPQPEFINEDDAADIGTGIYASQLFPSHINQSVKIDGRLSSEWFAQLSTFCCGSTTKSVSGDGFKYTSTFPLLADFVADGLDLPVATMAAQIRPGVSPVTDKALIGLALEEFGLEFSSGPGRENAKFTSTWLGTGQFEAPSGITIPATTTEHSLKSGQMTELSILGVNYITNKRFLSMSMNAKNNIRDAMRFFPGSGVQSGTEFQIGGRIWRGVPMITMNAVVLAEAGGAEEAALIAQTTGTASFTIVGAALGAAFHTAKMTLHKVAFKTAPLGEQDGLVTYKVEMTCLEHPSNGYATFEATCDQDDILAVA